MRLAGLGRSVACVFALLAPAAVTAAAPQTASLRASVVDENGVPVAGVEAAVLTSEGQTHTAFTDQAGRLELQSLPSGEAHATLSKPGFFRLAEQALTLEPGANEYAFTLNHETEIHETVEVTSSAERIDPQQMDHRDTLVEHEIINLPVPSTHDLKSSLPAIPGTVTDNSGELHVAGARAGQTEFLLDGFEIGDPATGQLGARVNVDSVRAVEVSSGRYGAQFAHAGAGVLALETAVGDDRWRSGATNFIPEIRLEQGTHFGNWYPRVTFSGPIAKGRAWFSDGASLQHTFAIVSEQPRGANTITQWRGDNLLRAQVHLTPRNVLQGSFLYNQEDAAHLGLQAFAPLSTTTDRVARRAFVSVKDQFWFRQALLELGVAADVGHSESTPQGVGAYLITPTGPAGNYFKATNQRARRLQVIGNVILPSRRWHGTHDFSAGFNMDERVFKHFAARTEIDNLRLDGTLIARTTFSGAPQFRLSNTEMGVYVQDSWQIFRPLIVSAGLRADHDRIIGQTLVAPRMGANFLPFRDARTKLAVGWGQYYQPLNLAQLGQAFDQQRTDLFFDPTGTVPVAGPFLSQFALPASGLEQPRFTSTSFEWDQKITEKTFAGAQFTLRDEHQGLAYVGLVPGAPPGTFLLENTRRDKFRAGEVWVRHRFGEQAEVYFDYTRSRANTNQVLDPTLGTVLFASQAPGPLDWDAPNRLLTRGWSPIPLWHLFVSYFLEYRSGYPFSVVNPQLQLVGPPNSRRFPDYVSLNLGIEKRFRFHGHEWAARLTVINLTGHENPNSVVNNIAAPNFLAFAGGQHRAISGRLRLVGRK